MEIASFSRLILLALCLLSSLLLVLLGTRIFARLPVISLVLYGLAGLLVLVGAVPMAALILIEV